MRQPAAATVRVRRDCSYGRVFRLAPKKVGKAKRLTLLVRFLGIGPRHEGRSDVFAYTVDVPPRREPR